SRRAPWADTVRAGEFVLGYPNEYGLLTDSPAVSQNGAGEDALPPHPGGRRSRDFGRNGSYLVLRQLRQDVRRFWRFMDDVAARSGSADRAAARLAVAAQMVG